jgi:hypothetical protein
VLAGAEGREDSPTIWRKNAAGFHINIIPCIYTFAWMWWMVDGKIFTPHELKEQFIYEVFFQTPWIIIMRCLLRAIS